jgi:acyl-coenzyme A thioesterase PaaI-like protein
MRELGHDFVARQLDDNDLDEVAARLRDLIEIVRTAPARAPMARSEGVANFQRAVAGAEPMVKHQLLSDSIVSGGANPMGLGAELWREGDAALMQVTLGKAFEGAPGRAHGGVLAALLDETMGLVNAMSGILAYTVQLDITYLAPAPINEPITARAAMVARDGRKITIEGIVKADDLVIARATALFITVDPHKFMAQPAPEEN